MFASDYKNKSTPSSYTEELDSEDVSSNFFADEELEELILLKDSPNPNLFLTKVAFIFIIYFTFCSLVNLFLILDMRRAKHWSRTLRLDTTFWYFLGASCTLKLLFTYFGSKIRNFSKFAFLIDCVITFFFMLGLYFWLDERMRKYYIYEGYYVIIIGFTLLSNSVFFLISTLVKSRTKNYSILYGFILMSLSSVLSLFFISKLYADTNITIGKYLVTFCVISFFNLYVCCNAYYVMKLKKEKYYDHEYVYCFFCFFGNITSFFWIDVVKDSKQYKNWIKKNKKNKRKAKMSRRKTKKIENDLKVNEKDVVELAEKEKEEEKEVEVIVEKKEKLPVVKNVNDNQDLESGSQI